MTEAKRFKAIACEIFERELAAVVAKSRNKVDLELLAQGLHNKGAPAMKKELQAAIDRTEGGGYEAVLLGYALCGNGLIGVTARSIPLVVPRAHDCIAVLMGSHERYMKEFNGHPGTYYKSPGWLEHSTGLGSQAPSAEGACCDSSSCGCESLDRAALEEKYGKEMADELMEELTGHGANYTRLAYIATGVGPEKEFERLVREDALANGLEYARIPGDLGMLQRMVDGEWDSGFLVVPPGGSVGPCYDGSIIKTVPGESGVIGR